MGYARTCTSSASSSLSSTSGTRPYSGCQARLRIRNGLVEHGFHWPQKGDRPVEKMSVKQMVEDARTRVKGLSKEEMQRELEAGEALIVDIRDVRERWRR